MISSITREQWLNEAGDMLLFDVLGPKTGIRGGLTDNKIKISVGFASVVKSNARNILGACYKRAASADGFAEIFISPICDDSISILATLAHELIHAIDDCKSGHKGFFANTARAIGLEGQMTATVPGKWLTHVLEGYVETLGPIPHSRLNLAESGRKKQANRNLLVACGCGFRFRTAQAQIDHVFEVVGHIACPACGEHMQQEGAE